MIRKLSTKSTGLYFLVFTLVLSACAGLTQSDKPALRVWWLQPVTGPSAVPATVPPVPLVLTLSVVPGLDSDQILALSGDAELKPYAGARWAEHLPELANSLIGRSLQASGRFELLHNRSARTAGGCDLQLEVRRFFAELGAGGSTTGVSVEISGRYQCGTDEARMLALHAQTGVSAEKMNIIVASFQKALNQVTFDLLKQL